MIEYKTCGLTLRSEFPIRELEGCEAVSGCDPPSVIIEFGGKRIQQRSLTLKKSGILFHAGDSELLLEAPDHAWFHVRAGSLIRICLQKNVFSDYVRSILLSSALGGIVHQRGMLPMRSNALTYDRKRALLIAGQSGAGKSTLAAELMQQGWRSLADDLCSVSVSSADPPRVHPFGPFLRLWSDAINRLGITSDRLTRSRPGLNKWILSLSDQQFHSGSLPVSAIVILTRTSNPPCLLERLTGAAAASAVARHTYRYHFVEPMNLAPAHLAMTARFAAHVPVFRIHCGLPFPPSSQLIEAVHTVQASNLH